MNATENITNAYDGAAQDAQQCSVQKADERLLPVNEAVVGDALSQPEGAAGGSPSGGGKRKHSSMAALIVSLLLMAVAALAGGALYLWGNANTPEVSESDVVSPSSSIVIGEPGPKYSEVHIEGIYLPEDEYGDGYMNADAALFVINEYRTRNGLVALEQANEDVLSAANKRLEEITTVAPGEQAGENKYFSHTRPDGSRFSTVFGECGVLYAHVAENLACGQFTAEHVVSDWINSAEHKANLLDEQITHVAIAVKNGPEGMPYWVFEGIAYAG